MRIEFDGGPDLLGDVAKHGLPGFTVRIDTTGTGALSGPMKVTGCGLDGVRLETRDGARVRYEWPSLVRVVVRAADNPPYVRD